MVKIVIYQIERYLSQYPVSATPHEGWKKEWLSSSKSLAVTALLPALSPRLIVCSSPISHYLFISSSLHLVSVPSPPPLFLHPHIDPAWMARDGRSGERPGRSGSAHSEPSKREREIAGRGLRGEEGGGGMGRGRAREAYTHTHTRCSAVANVASTL